MWNTLKKGFNKKVVKKFRIVYLSAVSLIVRLFFYCRVGNATRWNRIDGGDCSRRTIRTFVHQIFESDKAIRLLSTTEIQLLWGTLRTRMQYKWLHNCYRSQPTETNADSNSLRCTHNYTDRKREIAMKKYSLSTALITTVLIVTVSSVYLHPIRNYTGRERNHDEKKYFLSCSSRHWSVNCCR
jgi:hypothetical protein